MKKQIIGWQELLKIIAFFIMILLGLISSSALGYDKDSHDQIAVKSVQKSSLDDALQQIGFTIYNDSIKGSSKTKSIIDWIRFGSWWEDRIAIYNYNKASAICGTLPG